MPYTIKDCKILVEFQQNLVGCWRNESFGKKDGKFAGGEDNPLSYNIMPLPSVPSCPPSSCNPHDPENNGYILKNFKYTERLKFNDNDDKNTLAIAAEAPNRGGLVGQNCRALFYEQQVRFAEGPNGPENKDGPQVVHVENGAWLWLPRFVQQKGPYPDDIDKEKIPEDLEQPIDIMIAKQMAIPHGNTILALGSFDTIEAVSTKGKCNRVSTAKIPGSPVIPDGPTPFPTRLEAVCNENSSSSLRSNLNVCKRYSNENPYEEDNCGDYGYQNPHPDLTQFPNRPLQEAVKIIKPDYYMHWSVTTQPHSNGKGHVINIPFEQRVSDVIGYSAEYWLLFKDKNKRYLAYTQTIPMVFTIKNIKYVFPHITCNTVTFCPE